MGGLLKNSFLMQLYADVIHRPIGIITSDQGPALGSAIHAAVAAGAYPDIRVAAKAMGKLRARRVHARPAARRGLRPALRRVRDAPRLLRPWRQRRDAPPAGDEAGGVAGERRRVREIREAVCALHAELVRWGLVTWTSGNVSARVPGHDLMVIKPSGVAYHELTPESMVVTDLHGRRVDGDLAPSSDTFSHAFIYREMPDVNGVVHTHSTYATAWAARGEAIPCVLTAMADEFGGEIPIARFARIGDDDIGVAVVSTLRGHRSPAVLLRSHGVFTVGATAADAVKAAVMCEDAARTVHVARQLGEPHGHRRRRRRSALRPLPARLRPASRRPMSMSSSYEHRQIWFLTGSQLLYGDETLRQVADQSAHVVEQLNSSGAIPLPVVLQPVLKEQDAIHRQMLDVNADPTCVGVITWMHTFSPAKMWINGLQALQKPMLHLHTQSNVELPWAEIDMDFMNLNQAAHGDREFAHVLSRVGAPRKTVAGHVSDPAVVARIATWARAATGLAELRALKLARFGDNMRQVAVTEGDKVEAQLRFGVAVNTWGVNDLVDAVAAAADADVDALCAEYEDRYDVVAELRKGGERHESLRDGARIELGLRAFLDDGGFGAFTTNFEDLGGLRQLPGLARAAADGRRLRLRCRGRLEDRRHAARAEGRRRRAPRRHVVHGGLHVPPRARARAGARGAHARGVPVDRGDDAEPGDPPAVDRQP